MRAWWIGLALMTSVWADKLEGTLVQVQPEGDRRVRICLKNGEAAVEPISADLAQSRSVMARGLGERWTIFCNRNGQGVLVMTSASALGPDPALGAAFALVNRQIQYVADERWAQALANLAPDGRPSLDAFKAEWSGTLLSRDPAAMQVMCSNPTRLTVMVDGTHAGVSSYRSRGTYARRTSCKIDCQLQGSQWVIASMRP